MAVNINIQHAGNIGSARVRYEDLTSVDDGKGKKTKKWVSSSSHTVKAHEALDVFVGGPRRVVIEEIPN